MADASPMMFVDSKDCWSAMPEVEAPLDESEERLDSSCTLILNEKTGMMEELKGNFYCKKKFLLQQKLFLQIKTNL